MNEKSTSEKIVLKIIFTALLILVPLLARGQYVNSGISLGLTFESGVNWVDIDGDNDLDLTISGFTPFIWNGQGKLYLNTANVIAFQKDIRTIENGDQKWCDINHDGLPDLIYAGNGPIDTTAGIDIFDLSYNYTSFPAGFTPVSTASIDWGDYDNDGDYDVLISGKNNAGLVKTYLYSNNRGSFTLKKTDLPGIMNGMVGFIDYDLDQDLDIFISGRDINNNKYTRLWKNTNGTYSVTSDQFVNLEWSYFDWGDFNGDGYPDLLMGGYDATSGRGLLYINNSGNSFTLSTMKIPLFQQGSPGFADVDNDGDLDAFISGSKVSPLISNNFIFLNNSTDSLIPTTFTSDQVTRSFMNFGDYDNDNDLDIVFNGKKASGAGLTIIANNNTPTPNQVPSVPADLAAVIEGTSVTLKWSHSTDNNTPQKSLTYNIYVGTTIHGIDIVTPNANVNTGFRRIARRGYIQDTIWHLNNLPVGTYYWGVQTIDNSLGVSAFSSEGTFQIRDRFSAYTYSESGIFTSPAAYFDADHDKDLDLFFNSSNAFTAVENTLAPLSFSNYRTIQANGYNPVTTISPNDYDNDNTIDFSISGDYTLEIARDSTIALYGYNSPFNYDVINPELIKNVNFEYAIWADFNNDGRQDIICSGKTTNLLTANVPVTLLYKNIGNGVFEKVTHSIRGFEKCGAVAGDFDNDMDIDLFIYGKDQNGAINTYIYVNQGNFTFTENLVPGNQLYRGNLRFGIVSGDFDLDGQLDIYLGGVNSQNDTYARVLMNKNLNFQDANLQIQSSPNMSNFWADYDYDGDLDIYSVTAYNSPDKTRLYINNNGILDEKIIDLGTMHKLDLPFMAVNLDKLNGLDFLMRTNGTDYKLYYDNWGSNKRLSAAPENIRYNQDQLDIILQWDELPDCKGCTYNIRVGSTPGGVDIMSPMSDLTSGFRYVVQPGNTFLNNKWKLIGLPVGQYYWSVQAVDQANSGGPWSDEGTFNLTQINSEFSYTTECFGTSTVFTDLSVATDAVIKWKWNFGDGTTSGLQNPSHTFSSSGIFTVGLWAYSLSGDSAYKSHAVTVKPSPVADFSVSLACLGNTNTITNNTNENGLTITGWLWDYGDGSLPYTGKEPGSHGYTNPGSYNISLKVTADNTCWDTISKGALVAQYPVTTVSADDALTFCMGDSVTFSVPYNSMYTYQWKLNGTNISNADSSRLTAKITGSYSVEATNPVGSCSRTSDQQIVTARSLPPSYTIVTSGPVTFCSGDSVILSVTENSAYTYQWKQNGGAVGTNSSLLVVKSSGIYTLTVSNSTGCSISSSNSVTVTVNPLPIVGAVSLEGKKKFCSGESVILSVPATAGYLYAWINSDGKITGASSNSYIVNTSDEYKLEVSNSSGCKVITDPVKIEVVEKPSKPAIDTSFYDKDMCLEDKPLNIFVDDIVAGYDYKWYRNGTPFSTSTSIEIIEEGTYYLEAVYDICTSQRDSAVIDFREALPKPRIDARGPAVWLLSTTSKASQYKWFLNGIAILGAESSSYMAGQNYGLYRLAIADEKGCFSFSDTLRIPTGITGIDDTDPFSNVKIYPNPTTGTFTIEMNNNVFGELIIDIFAQNGSKIINIKFDKTTLHFQSQIDLSGQSKGMYILNLSLDKFRAVRKVLVE